MTIIASSQASWITLPQAVVCTAIERLTHVRCGMSGREGSLRLWIGPIDKHRTSWFDISTAGEITATTRGNGQRLILDDVTLDDLPLEAARMAAWADGIDLRESP